MIDDALDEIGEIGFDDTPKPQKDETADKQKYINENIIAKGYNLEELCRSITIRKGLTINEISLDTLKTEVEFFKNQQMKEAIKSVKSTKMGKTKKEDLVNELYQTESLSLKTAAQQDNKLMELEKEGKRINPVVTDAKTDKVKGLIKNKFYYTFTVSTPELGTNVKRTLEDFEFFKAQLNEKYPFIYVPPLPPRRPDNKVYDQDLLLRYINRFLSCLVRKKILRTSPITLEFLELETGDFDRYRQMLIDAKFVCQYNMENYKTMKGQLQVEFNQTQVPYPEKFYKRMEATQVIYKSLNNALKDVVIDFSNLYKHMKKASDAFSALSNNGKENELSPIVVEGYEKLKNIFNSWSQAYQKQRVFMNQNFREFFNYMNLQIKEILTVHKQYMKIKNDYEQYGLDMLTKKEKLFNEKKYSKWELSDEDLKNLDSFKDNREESFKNMLPGLTNLVGAQKVQVACSCNIVAKQYQKLVKHQGEQLKNYLTSLKEENQSVVGDAYILCSLFNITLGEEKPPE